MTLIFKDTVRIQTINRCMSIALSTKVQAVINAIVNGTSETVVDPGDGKVYVLNISNREMGTIIYTVFDENTRFPIESFAVKYGHQHIIHQILYSSMIRTKLDHIADLEIPGMERPEFDPMIIPALTQVYPTDIKK